MNLRLFAIIGLLLLLSANTCLAIPLSNGDNSEFYYKIGGARSISVPPNINVQTHALNGSLEYGLGYSCGNFDPMLGLTNLMNDLQNTGNNLVNGAIGAVQAAIGGLPALIMQRIDPGLYDLFQNALIRVEAILSLANKSCEQYEQEIKQGLNPYAEWTDLSKIVDWKVQMGSNGYGGSNVDVVQAKENVERSNGDNGVPWIGGKKAGGKNMDAIKATSDVVKAGYNITLNRSADDNSAPNSPNNAKPQRLIEVFAQPKDASEWAVDVLGDAHIYTHDNRPVETVPGHGLLPKIAGEMTDAMQKLIDLVTGNAQTTLGNLGDVSSNAVLINQDVINAIQSLKPGEQSIAVSKLASEVAMAKVVEKALIIRRMLITASREPNVANSPAPAQIEQSISRLDREINDIMYERRIHNELASQTPAAILGLQAEHDNRSQSTNPAAGSEDSLIEDGAINP
ncbi:integrating conjugative element protein [Methylotuvimicrobium sp. KM1]|uniref:integrating conjugative element protein n=1 Tax=Methylotuvimicrobium sp. KM1 TaxID=3377707 RepID=UPI00384EF221